MSSTTAFGPYQVHVERQVIDVTVGAVALADPQWRHNRWVVFDLDWDDEYVWDLGRRGVDSVIRRST